MTATQLPKVRWRFRFPIGAFLSGLLGGFGILLFLQQAAIAYPTRNLSIGLVAGGGLLSLLLRNVAARIGVSRLNGRLARAERSVPDAPVVPASVESAPVTSDPEAVATPVATTIPADEEVSDSGAAWTATHIVPSTGMPAWPEPDKAGPPETQLEAGLELRVLARENGLAQVEAYNGWVAWVDGRSLRRKHG
ncbi:MAG TPA: hypothetical protein VM143_01790 [Acidimicrobiales bacterium]|nr:hypothetical protein [Acidimicrobiales bacterium]